MVLRTSILVLFLLNGQLATMAQQSDLSKVVSNLRETLFELQVQRKPDPGKRTYFPVFLDGKPANYDTLNQYTLDDVIKLTLNRDRNMTVLFGTSGLYGIIEIRTKQTRSTDQEKDE